MKRGEIWTVAGGGGYANKPRPVAILQDHRFSHTRSITVCGFSSYSEEISLFRLLVRPTQANGLRVPCRLMVDKIVTVPKSKLGTRIGRLSDVDIQRLNRAMVVFLGIAD
ncbi:MAG TPA: type II toxin-antitoxin system PemK/MazF family toxin [Terriglobales bacterium]